MQENKNININLDKILTEEERNALGLITDEKQRAFYGLPSIFRILLATILVIGFIWGVTAALFPEKFSESIVNFSLYSKEEAVQII